MIEVENISIPNEDKAPTVTEFLSNLARSILVLPPPGTEPSSKVDLLEQRESSNLSILSCEQTFIELLILIIAKPPINRARLSSRFDLEYVPNELFNFPRISLESLFREIYRILGSKPSLVSTLSESYSQLCKKLRCHQSPLRIQKTTLF